MNPNKNVRKYLAEIGRRGGAAGRGKVKAVSPERARAGIRARRERSKARFLALVAGMEAHPKIGEMLDLLNGHEWNVLEAARTAGVSRQTLYTRMEACRRLCVSNRPAVESAADDLDAAK